LMLIQAHPQGFSLFKTRKPLGHLLRGAVGIVSMGLIFWSFSLLPLANATALQFAMPLILTALSVPLLGEWVGKWRWGAVIVGFAGVLVIAAPTGAGVNWLGLAVALGGAFTTACTMIIVRRLGRSEHALTIVFYFSLWGALVTACFLPFYWTPPSFKSFVYLVMTGICGGAAQVLVTKAYAEGPAAYVAPFSYLAIIFGTFFGWAVWDQVPGMNVLIGSGVVVASGLFILYREAVLRRHVVQESVLDIAPTEADEYGPAPDESVTESGQADGEMRYQISAGLRPANENQPELPKPESPKEVKQ
ncbi:MAG: DMT family transporter, partial [Rhodospirillales bacterium]|nr:DMT family transporter [Rhodospirillales bacterium]